MHTWNRMAFPRWWNSAICDVEKRNCLFSDLCMSPDLTLAKRNRGDYLLKSSINSENSGFHVRYGWKLWNLRIVACEIQSVGTGERAIFALDVSISWFPRMFCVFFSVNLSFLSSEYFCILFSISYPEISRAPKKETRASITPFSRSFLVILMPIYISVFFQWQLGLIEMNDIQRLNVTEDDVRKKHSIWTRWSFF